jgi:hypothetical protein
MPGWWVDFTSRPEAIGLAIFMFVALLAGGFSLWRWLHSRPNADEVERRRRETLVRSGKMGDGEIVEVETASIVYSYYVRGVGYTASQDVAALISLLPADQMKLIGPVSVRFDPRNPANSIVLSEQWSGLRNHR